MARVLGASGAWQGVAKQVSSLGYTVEHPEEIPKLAAYLREQSESLLQLKHKETREAVAQLEGQIDQLQSQEGILRRLRNWWTIRRRSRSISAKHKAEASYAAHLSWTIETLELLSRSPELAGAKAELEVIDCLRSLPDDYLVYNDVRLHSSRHLVYKGKSVQSAQVDHMVVGPGGVFVIETKCWSRQFAQSGQGHSPMDQVGRASYLCYKLLQERYGKTKVRSIIASQGALPPGENDKYVTVLRPERLCRYINAGRAPVLSPTQIERLHWFFEPRVATYRP